MNIYFVRHGIALDRDDPRCPPEAQRPLTREGFEKTAQAAKGLKALGIKPDRIFTSHYLRAKQTAETMAKILEFSGDIKLTDALLPDADPIDLFSELKRARGEKVMCFGHAPSIDAFVAHAVGHDRVFTKLKKAGVALIHWPVDRGEGDLLSLWTPSVLIKLGEGA